MRPLAFLRIGCFSLIGCLCAVCTADIIHLNDGTTIEGQIHRSADGWTVTDSSGKTVTIEADMVRSIEVGKGGGATSETPQEALAELRRSTANLGDIPQILERYQRFLSQHATGPEADQAKQDMAMWQDRLNRGMVRAGRQWVTPGEYDALRAAAGRTANDAAAMLASGQVNQAEAKVDQGLQTAPDSPELLFLKGVLLYRRSQLVPARNAFQAAEAALPDYGAIHNNIAVILYRTHAQMQALTEYDKAMANDAENRTILDNLQEALHALPEQYRKNDLTKRVVARFNEQDTLLQHRMADAGLYRWGSQWLDAKEYESLRAAKKEVQDKIDGYQKQFDANAARIAQIDRSYADDQQMMAVMASQSQQIDPATRRLYTLPLPQQYYDLQRDLLALSSEKGIKQREQQELQREAQEEQLKMPKEPYTGVQRIFGAEATPGRVPPTPTTLPAATQPARDDQ